MSNLNFNNKGRVPRIHQKRPYFDSRALQCVADAADTSEQLVNDFYKLSSSQWLKNRYDIKTAKDLEPHEILDGPFAQVVKYEGIKKDLSLKSFSYYLYKICLQDWNILNVVEKKKLTLDPFLIYILTHELVHVVRFSKFKQRYENKNEADVTFEEEKKVHQLTYDILCSLSIGGLEQVFEFYGDWF